MRRLTLLFCSLCACSGGSEEDAGPRDGSVDAGVVDSGSGNLRCQSFAASVQPIFSQRCAIAGCHIGSSPASELNLSIGRARDSLLGQSSVGSVGELLVRPGRPAESYLISKLVQPPVGERMPKDAPPLSDVELSQISRWVQAGAPAGGYPPCDLVVEEVVVESVSVTGAPARLMVGELATLTATAVVSKGGADDLAFSWRSTDNRVVYVDGSGNVLAVAPGRASLTTQVGGTTSNPVDVQVTQAPAASATLQDALPVMTDGCAVAGCHVLGPNAGRLRLDLDEPELRALLASTSTQTTLRLIEAGEPMRSYLLLKILDPDPEIGLRMPIGLPRPEAARLAPLLHWIRGGAR